jgi:hypothetical protein
MEYIPKHLLNDDIIYHYCSISTAIEFILFEGELKLSPRQKSTDPIENLDFKRESILWGEPDESLFKIGRNILNDAKRKVHKP